MGLRNISRAANLAKLQIVFLLLKKFASSYFGISGRILIQSPNFYVQNSGNLEVPEVTKRVLMVNV